MTAPAVAVMAKVPGAVPVKSRLHGALTPAGATALYRAFLLDRLELVASLGGVAPVVAFTPPEAAAALRALAPAPFRLLAQRGDGLGERLLHLFEDLLGAGHPAVVVTDSDSPTLPPAHLAEALATLGAGEADLVLGPTDDGGYYLLGLTTPRPRLFADVPWSTDAVRAVTLARAREAGLRVHLLPPWYDVDHAADLDRLAADLAGGHLAPHTRAALRGLRP